MRRTKERKMDATHNTRRIRPWSDWLLLVVVFVALLVPLDLVADGAYRTDGSVLYWLLVAYSYPDATVVGLAMLALALLTYWISLRRLERAGLSPRRALNADPSGLPAYLPSSATPLGIALLAVNFVGGLALMSGIFSCAARTRLP